MKRLVTLFAVISYLLIITVLKDLILLSVPIIWMGLIWTQKNYRKLYILLILLILISVYYSVSVHEAYEKMGNHVVAEGQVKPYGVDYQLIIDKKTRVLIKKDHSKAIESGSYHVEYEKNVFFYQNPNTFNYKNHLHSKGFVDVVKQSELTYKQIRRKKRFDNTLFDSFLNRLSQTKHYVYYKGILFNDKSGFDKEVLEMFRDNGSSHVLSISGLHIGLIFGFSYGVLRVFDKRLRRGVACFVVFLYVLSINMPISSVRALSMISFSVLAIYQNRKYDLLQTLGLIGWFLMLLNPYIVYHSGFQYSFVAVLVIEVCYKYFFKSVENHLLQLLILPIVIQIGMLPLVVYHNNQIHLLSFVANIPTVLLIGIVLNGLLLSLVIPSMTLLYWIDYVFDMILGINHWLYNLDWLKLELPSIPFVMVVLLYMVLFLVHERKHRRQLALITLIVVSCWTVYYQTVIEVYFFDVGQGDCVLIKKGSTTFLVDGGIETDNDHLRGVLYKQGITSIDYLIVSHGHLDHIGGLLDINEMTTDSRLFYKPPNEQVLEFDGIRYKEKISVDQLDTFALGWCEFQFVHYPSSDELNNASLVVNVMLYENTLLLTGDIEAEVEKVILDQLYEVDFLKVPHHGSKTSSIQSFVDQVSPEIAVICVGKNNYGHPHREVVDRYRRLNAQVYETNDGCVKLYVFPFGNYFVKAFD